MRDIDNGENTISIRDLDVRRDDLQADADALAEEVQEASNAVDELMADGDASPEALVEAREALRQAEAALEGWTHGDEGHELSVLNDLVDEAIREAADGRHGTLIRESYWEKYQDELLTECGDIPRNLPSYITVTVDYDALKIDYAELDYDGVTYLVRG